MVGSALGAPGDASDPAVTLSYLNNVFTPQVTAEYTKAVNDGLNQTYFSSFRMLTESVGKQRLAALRADTAKKRASGTVLLKQGDVLTAAPGCKVTLKSGSIVADTSFLVDVTNGKTVTKNTALVPRTLYMMGDSSTGELAVKSATCELTVTGVYQLSASAATDYGSMADALNTMGLFLGTGSGYSLENSASRAQGLVMFLRILGLESKARAYTGSIPFTDVPKSHWAYPYVAYAYQNGLTSGTSATTFSPERAITCQHYATFLMRALNYTENTSFTYATAVKDLVTLGLLSQGEANALSAGAFLRYKMVYLSYYGLYGVDQKAGKMLMTRLVDDGSVTEKNLLNGIYQVYGTRIS